MAGFSVEADSLSWFGEQFTYFGENDMAEVGPYVKRYVGQTGGMDGVLSTLIPGIELLTQTFGDHYTGLATVVSGTGSGLVQTGQGYARTDQQIEDIEGLIRDIGTIPGVLVDISHIPPSRPTVTEVPVRPESPEPNRGRPLAAQLAAILASVRAEIKALDTVLATTRAELVERNRQRVVDPAMVRALRSASTRPEAPESLRRLAARIERGQLTWAEVIEGSADPEVEAFRVEAIKTARSQFDVPAPSPDPHNDPRVGKE